MEHQLVLPVELSALDRIVKIEIHGTPRDLAAREIHRVRGVFRDLKVAERQLQIACAAGVPGIDGAFDARQAILRDLTLQIHTRRLIRGGVQGRYLSVQGVDAR